jgi:hypothetical protein
VKNGACTSLILRFYSRSPRPGEFFFSPKYFGSQFNNHVLDYLEAESTLPTSALGGLRVYLVVRPEFLLLDCTCATSFSEAKPGQTNLGGAGGSALLIWDWAGRSTSRAAMGGFRPCRPGWATSPANERVTPTAGQGRPCPTTSTKVRLSSWVLVMVGSKCHDAGIGIRRHR